MGLFKCNVKALKQSTFGIVLKGGTTREDYQGPEETGIHRIEKLTTELMELEKRVQRSTDDPENYGVSLHFFKVVF